MSEPVEHVANRPDATALREFIGEHLDMARMQAEFGVTYAAIGDDVGLDYTLRQLVARIRAVLPVLKELREPGSVQLPTEYPRDE